VRGGSLLKLSEGGEARMLQEFGNIGLLLIVALIFPLMALVTAFAIRPHPRQNDAEKSLPYECGVDTVGETWVQFRASYFLYALVFVAFDIETVFLYLWAIKFQQLGTFAFVEMFIFLSILVVGLGYAWKKGALEWK
jgi:NADH-quinone oxidoreductase subunit A